ncbi:MFS transporter [Pseudohalioglobus sediminis]|uniref:MFS transporter n=1 Tax=Pseudohalioglobus sediminis TaxID=2606449 RepID=A0A5B0WT21_9GAMM|nr:MFS transporter [Pseudohalioglobus sediminis]KAA1189627.1 MFS transporter [Pseudohalioglobus sediminis]
MSRGAVLDGLRFWMPAMAGMTCLGLGVGLLSIFGFFVPALSQEFGVGVALINMAPVMMLLAPGLLSPLVGRVVDRWSIRHLLLLGSAVAMGSLLVLSQADSIVMVALCFLVFSLGLVCYGPVVINALMVKQYPGREGRALAIASLGISVSSVTLPVFVGFILQWVEWRTALALLAIAMMVILWAWILAALAPGIVGAVSDTSNRVSGEILRRRAFWLVGVIVAMALAVTLLLAICYPPLFANRGFSAVESGLFLSVAGSAGFGGKLIVASLVDRARQHIRWIVAFLLSVSACGLLLLADARSGPMIIACVALLGFSGGSFLPLHPYLNSRYFPPEIIGQVNGAQSPMFLPLGLAGPPLAGYVYDVTGSYQLVIQGLAVLPVIGLCALLALPSTER